MSTFFFPPQWPSQIRFFCHLCSLKSCWKGREGMKGSGQTTMFSGVTVMTSWPYSELSAIPTQVQPLQKPLCHWWCAVCTAPLHSLTSKKLKENLSEPGQEFALPYDAGASHNSSHLWLWRQSGFWRDSVATQQCPKSPHTDRQPPPGTCRCKSVTFIVLFLNEQALPREKLHFQ